MAIGDAYATPQEYRAAKGAEDTSDDLILQRELNAVSRYIDRKLDRHSGFNKDDTATIRIYMPKSGRARRRDGWAESENPRLYSGTTQVLDVDDLVSVTSITIDTGIDNTFATTLAVTDYELLPRNAAVGPEPAAYTQIRMTEWGSHVGWPVGARVKVTGIHGWPSVPTGINWACIELTSILRVESPFATGRVNEMDQVLDMSGQARAVLSGLMSNYSKAVSF